MEDNDILLLDLENKNKEIEVLKQEIKDLKEEIITLRQEVSIDFSSGALSRKQGIVNLGMEINRISCSGSNLTIAFLDIDSLKSINDRFGHFEGDKIIRELTSTVMKNIRDCDFVYRYGGDEFIIVFKNAGVGDAKKIWSRIEENILLRNKELNVPYKMSVTAGFAQYEKELDINEFISRADNDMYKNRKRY